VLDTEGHALVQSLAKSQGRDQGRHPVSQVDQLAVLDFAHRASGDGRRDGRRHRLRLQHGSDLAGDLRPVSDGHLVLLRIHHDRIHQSPGDDGQARVYAPRLYPPLHLRDDFPPGVFRRDGQRIDPQGGRLMLHRNVSLSVCRGAADDGDVHMQAGIEEIFPVPNADNLAERSPGGTVGASTFDTGVHVRVQADIGEQPGAARPALAQPVEQRPDGEVVGLHLVLRNHAGDLVVGEDAKGATDHSAHQPNMSQPVDAGSFPAADHHRMDDGEIPRPALAQESSLDSPQDSVRFQHGEAAADGDRRAVRDQLGSLVCGHDRRLHSPARFPFSERPLGADASRDLAGS
jgi:hypothetical protein